jgi:hypothetical protein
VTVSGGDLAGLNAVVGLNLSSPTIADLAGNALPITEPGTDETYTVDNTAPSTTSFTRKTPSAQNTNADVLIFLATFSEDVQNVDAADFTATGTTGTIAVTQVTPSTYDVTVSGGDLAGLNAVVGLNLSSPTIVDLAGNPLPNTEPGTDETYTVSNAAPSTTTVSLSGVDLLIEDSDGADTDDTLTVSTDGIAIIINDPSNLLGTSIVGASGDGTHTISVPLATAGFTGVIVFNTLGGDDTLTVDFSGGNFTKAIDFRGGANVSSNPGDRLVLQGGGSFTNANFGFTNAHDGTIVITGNSSISYTGLEPITSNITAANVTLNYSATGETLTVTDAGSGKTTVTSNTAAETVTFNNPTGTLLINAGDTGDDIINVTSLAAGFAGSLTIDGQGGSDTININGAVGVAAGRSVLLTADILNVNANVSTGNSTTGASGSVQLTGGNVVFTNNSLITTGDSNLTGTAGVDAAASGSITIVTSGTGTVTGAGGLVTGVATVDGTGGGSDTATAGTISVTSVGNTNPGINLSGGITTGSATVNNAANGDDSATSGSIVLSSFGNIGTSTAARQVVGIGTAAGGATNSAGSLSVTVDNADVNITSPSNLTVSTLRDASAVFATNNIRIATSGSAELTITGTGTNNVFFEDLDLDTVNGLLTITNASLTVRSVDIDTTNGNVQIDSELRTLGLSTAGDQSGSIDITAGGTVGGTGSIVTGNVTESGSGGAHNIVTGSVAISAGVAATPAIHITGGITTGTATVTGADGNDTATSGTIRLTAAGGSVGTSSASRQTVSLGSVSGGNTNTSGTLRLVNTSAGDVNVTSAADLIVSEIDTSAAEDNVRISTTGTANLTFSGVHGYDMFGDTLDIDTATGTIIVSDTLLVAKEIDIDSNGGAMVVNADVLSTAFSAPLPFGSGDININITGSLTGTGAIRSGNATDTNGANGVDSVITGDVIISAASILVSGGISTGNAQVQGADGNDSTTSGTISLTATVGNIGTDATTRQTVTVGSSIGGNVNTSGTLQLDLGTGASSVNITSASDLIVSRIANPLSTSDVRIQTTGAANLTLTGANGYVGTGVDRFDLDTNSGTISFTTTPLSALILDVDSTSGNAVIDAAITQSTFSGSLTLDLAAFTYDVDLGGSLTGSGSITTGNATVSSGSGGAKAVSTADISITAASILLSGGLTTGNATMNGADGDDTATSGSILLTTTSGDIGVGSTTRQMVTVGSATGGSVNNLGTLDAKAIGSDINITSASDLIVSRIETAAGADNVRISTTGTASLTLKNGESYTNVATDLFDLDTASGNVVIASIPAGLLVVDNLDVDSAGGAATVSANIATTGNFTVDANLINLTGNFTVATTGAGAAAWTALQSIGLAAGSSITTVNGGINLQANTSATANGNFVGITLDNAALTTSGNGAIVLMATGGNTADDHGIVIAGGSVVSSTKTSTGAGGITLIGTGRTGAGSDGVRVENTNTFVRSQAGAIQITGSSGNDEGIVIANNATVQSLGSGAGAATVTIHGTSGPTNDSNGVAFGNSAAVSSVDGDIQIDGIGTGGLRGVYMFGNATVTSTGTTVDAATVTINGTSGSDDATKLDGSHISSVAGAVQISGTATSGIVGVSLFNASSVTVTTGPLMVTGTGGTGAGVRLSDTTTGSLISNGGGTISVTAFAGGVASGGSSVIGGVSAAGDITIASDTVALTGGTIRSTGALTIRPNTASATIGIGGGAGTLNLTDGELATFMDGFNSITIGDVANGSGTVTVESATFLDPVILAGGVINDGAGTDLTAPSVTLDGNVSPGQSPGVLNVAGNATFAGGHTFTVQIGGTTPGTAITNHDQLDATGSVTIGSNVSLATASFNSFVPAAGQQFEIINRTGGSGTFNGLAEGATVSTNFLGSGLKATISYAGGDGDDVVITVLAASTTGVQLFIPTNLTGAAGGTVTVPVNILVTEPDGIDLGAVDLVIQFDSTKFTASNFQLGSLVTGAGFSSPFVNSPVAGVLTITFSSPTGTANLPLGTSGSVLLFDLTVVGGAASGSSPLNLRDAFNSTVTALTNNNIEELNLVPAPTDADSDSVDGVFTIDNTAPVTTSFTRKTPAAANTNADTLVFLATFSEAVLNVDSADFAVTGTTGTIAVTQVTASTFDVTISGGDLAGLNGTVGLNLNSPSITDLAGNALPNTEPATDQTYLVDNTAPVTTSFTRKTPAAANTNADTLVFLATFSEDVLNVDSADFAVTGTTGTIAVTQVTASTFDVTISGGDLAGLNGTVGLNLNSPSITDLAGNALPNTEPTTDQTYLVDNTAPVTTSFTRKTPAAANTNADTLVFLATFSEAVLNVDAADFAVTGTTGTIAVTQVTASTFDVTISGGDLAALNGTVGLNLASPSIADLAGNALPNTEPGTDETYNVTNTVQVSTLTPTDSGVVLDFNTVLDVTPLNLYDSQSGSLGPADVTLVGNTVGAVRGSLVFDGVHQQATFIATGGPLAPDTYTLTLRSAVNGFVDPSGNLLDGNSDGIPGDDYSSTFVVTARPANEVVISIPDFARGYGQTVDLPGTTNSGIPITLSTGQDVTAVDFDLVYDPALLTPTGFTTMISGAATAFNILSPGLVRVSVSSAVEFSATAGSIELGRMTATVPNTAPYASKHILNLTNLNVEDSVPNPRPVRADDGIHLAAYVGDQSGNERYSGGDTTLLQRQIVGLGNGFTAYQLADPVLLADLNRGGTITGGDTTLMQRVIVGIPVTQVPNLPIGLDSPAPGGPDPKLFVPTDISGLPGSTVTVPVMVEVTEATGIDLGAVDLVIQFDSTKFTTGNFRLGSLLAGAGFSAPFVNIPTPGVVTITFSSPTGTANLPHGTLGSVLLFDLTVEEDAATGPSRLNLRQNFNSTFTALTNNDIEELVLVPAPTNADTDSVDGVFTVNGADTTPPVFSSIVRQTPASSPTNADTLIFRATFSEDVLNVDAADFAVTGTTANITAVTPVTGTSVFNVTVSGGDLAGLNGTVGLDLAGVQNIADVAGNALPSTEPATDETYVVDNTIPVFNSITRQTPASPTNADSLVFDILFNESVVNVSADDFVIVGTTATGVLAGSGSAYTLTVSGGNLAGLNGTVGLDLAAGQNIADVAGNSLAAGEPGIDETYLVDNTTPTLTAFARNTPATSPTNADTLVFDITFDENVANVSADDFTITGTTATGVLAGSGSAYTLTVSGGNLAGLSGTVGLDLAAGQNIADVAGNSLPAGEPGTDETYAVDNTAPIVTLSSPAFTNDTTPSVTVTATDSGSGVPDGTAVNLDVDLNNDGDFADAGEAAYSTSTLSSGSATFDVSPALANGTYPMQARASDLAGNKGTSTISTTVVDTTAPATTTLAPADDATGVAVASNLVITFNENVQKGTGNILIKKSSDNSIVQTIAVTDGTVTISGAVATINPPADLAESTSFYVEVAAGVFEDLAANDFAGISGNSAWNFTTQADGGISVTIPTDLRATPGSLLSVPIHINDANNVESVDIQLSYDTTFLNTTSAQVRAGSVWPGSATVVANVNDAAGIITVTVFNTSPLAAGAGSLVIIEFDISTSAPLGATTPLNLQSVSLNEDDIPVTPNPTGGADSTDGLITFLPATPIVVSRTDSPSAIEFTFSETMDGSTWSLYDTAAGSFGAADVTLVGNSVGAITGSLVFSGNHGAFVPTGGLLPPDTYTLRLRSAANAFKAADDGELLDGDANGTTGDDYVATITIGSPAPIVVGLPDFVRGPRQPVDVPATAAGLPIRVSNGAGVESVDLTIVYDASLLTITGGVVGPDAPFGSSVVVNAGTPGVAVVTFFSPTALTPGAATIVSLVATVPSGATYKASHLLHISSLSINEGGLAATADDAIHVAAYFGDATGNGGYSGLDAQRVARVSVGLDSGYSAYPLIDPVIIGDITGNGALSGLDANRIAQEAVGIDRPEIPPIPSPDSQPSAAQPSAAQPSAAQPSAAQPSAADAVFYQLAASSPSSRANNISDVTDNSLKAKRIDQVVQPVQPPVSVSLSHGSSLLPRSASPTQHEKLTDAIFGALDDRGDFNDLLGGI